MKSFLRFLLVVLGIIVVGILVLGIVEPKDSTMQRSIVINAPKSVVFEQIVKFKNWPHWSPWYQMDTNVQMTYNGIDGTQGSNYHWTGDPKKTGEGEMINAGVTASQMNYELHFIKPFSGEAKGYFTVSDTAGGQTKVTWSISMHQNFPMNAMNAFMNMDKIMGGDFERGLQNMKKYAEANMTAGIGTSIQETDIPAMMYAGVRKQMSWNELQKFYMDTYGMLYKEIHPDINSHTYSLFYNWDTVHHTADIAAVVPVADTTMKKNGVSYFSVPALKAYTALHTGGYASMGKEHNALMQYVAAKNQHISIVMEEYITGPGTEKDSTRWVTRIIYALQ